MLRLLEKEKVGAQQDKRNVLARSATHILHILSHTCPSKCTHIDVILVVALVQVVHDGGLVQLSQRRHVLNPIDAGLVHGVHPLPGDLGLLQVQHLEERQRQTVLLYRRAVIWLFLCVTLLPQHFNICSLIS